MGSRETASKYIFQVWRLQYNYPPHINSKNHQTQHFFTPKFLKVRNAHNISTAYNYLKWEVVLDFHFKSAKCQRGSPKNTSIITYTIKRKIFTANEVPALIF